MNEMNELERHLRSWAPRRPSAKLRQQLFAGSVSALETPDEPTFRFGWLAPATAAFLLMAVMFSQRNSPVISGSSNSSPMVAMIMSNQSAAAYLPGSFQSDHNKLAGETFEWTNGSRSTSSIRSLSHSRGSNE